MNTPPVPFPGDAVAVRFGDGGWQAKPGADSSALPIHAPAGKQHCCTIAQPPYVNLACTLPRQPPHMWHIATVPGNHVVAVWPDPVEMEAAALAGEQIRPVAQSP